MESRAKFLGHPIHPMLITFPLGLFGMALIFDLIAAVKDSVDIHRAANYMIAAGIITGLLAAIFGAIDWFAIPSGTRAKRIGAIHGLGNVAIVIAFAVAWLLRRDSPEDPSTLTVIIEAVAVVAALGTGWLGGELVDRLGVGVDPGANLDASNSLSGQPIISSRAD